ANVSRFIGKCWYVQGNAYWRLRDLDEARACLEKALAILSQGIYATFWPRVHEIQRCIAVLAL
ncbi:MAG: tetratricopeptide repeat protein, partial [Ktedonobacterales bacterium]|nr:tetratricopeptide repeat protein [Ktedonobacterales bacterium]